MEGWRAPCPRNRTCLTTNRTPRSRPPWRRLRPPGDGATITPYRDGPLIVRGDFRLVDQDGAEIDPGRTTIALCRCGKSGIKPFCDGAHKRSGFSAPSAPSRPRPAAQIVREARADD